MTLTKKISSDIFVTSLIKSSLKIRGLVLIPILTLSIGIAEYGAYIQVIGIAVLTTNLFLLGLDSGYVRYINEMDSPSRLYTTLLLIGVASATVGGILIGLSAEFLARYTLRDESFSFLFLLGGLYVPIHALFRITHRYFQANRRIKLYSLLEGIDVYFSVAAIAFAVFVLETWIVGVFLALIVARVLVLLGTFVLILRDGGIGVPTADGLFDCLRFSLGTMGHLISQSALDKADRILLGFFIGAGAVGIYSAAYSVAYVILLYFRPLSVSFFPEFSKLWSENEFGSIQSYSIAGLRYFGILSIPSVAGFWVVGEDVLRILTTQDVAAAAAIPLVVIAAAMVAKGVGELYTQLYFAADEARIPAVVQGGTVFLNTSINVALIPMFGVIGAAAATMLSFSVGTIVLVVWFQKYLRVLPRMAHVGYIGTSTAVMVALLVLLPVDFLWPLTVLFGAGVYFATIITVGCISRQEIKSFFDIISKLFD